MDRNEGLKRIRDSFGNLIGCTIVDVIVQPNVEYRDIRPDIGLVVEKAEIGPFPPRLVIWASQDAEGNGPGWFEVQEVKA